MKQKKLYTWGLGLLVPLIIVLVWIYVSINGIVSPMIIPKISSIGKAFANGFKKGTILLDLRVSFWIVLRGYFAGVVLGLIFGILMGISTTATSLFSPFFNAVRQIPPLAWIPILILWIGIGDISKIVLIGLGVFFPVLLNTMSGIQDVSGIYLEFADNYHIKKSDIFLKILIPGAAPSIFVGLRLGASTSWMSIVAAEMIAAIAGVGYRISTARNMMETPTVIAYMILIGVVGGLMDKVLRTLEKRAIRWKNK